MDPLTLALLGTALTGGGALAGMFGRNKVEDARAATLATARGLNQGLQTEAGVINDRSADRFTDFGGQQTTRASQLAEMFRHPTPDAVPGPTSIAPLPEPSAPLIAGEVGRQQANIEKFSNHQADTLGQMRAFGDVLGKISRGQARDASSIGQIGGFERGNASVVPAQLNADSHAGDGWSFAGNLLSGGGKVALTSGLAGQFVPGGVTPAQALAAGTTPV